MIFKLLDLKSGHKEKLVFNLINSCQTVNVCASNIDLWWLPWHPCLSLLVQIMLSAFLPLAVPVHLWPNIDFYYRQVYQTWHDRFPCSLVHTFMLLMMNRLTPLAFLWAPLRRWYSTFWVKCRKTTIGWIGMKVGPYFHVWMNGNNLLTNLLTVITSTSAVCVYWWLANVSMLIR